MLTRKKSGLKSTPKKSPSKKEVLEFAIAVSGSKSLGEKWFKSPSNLLGDLTPEQAVREGKGKRALGILQNIAGI